MRRSTATGLGAEPKIVMTALRIAVGAGTRVEYETFWLIFARWLWVRVCPMSRALTGIYWRDISDRKSAEAALGDSEERFRRVFEQSPLGMVAADLDGRLRQANAALCRMLGYSAEELAGLCYLDIVHKDDREECERQSRAVSTSSGSATCSSKSGSTLMSQ